MVARAAPHVHGPACVLCMYYCVCIALHHYCCMCVRMCYCCLCASLPGSAIPLLCALAATQTIDFVFFSRYKQNPGGVFREKNFFILCFCFCLGNIILKFIFDFGIRENKKDGTEVPSCYFF